jgi:hypothetical protein
MTKNTHQSAQVSCLFVAVEAAHAAAIIRDGHVPFVSIQNGPVSPSGQTAVELRVTSLF